MAPDLRIAIVEDVPLFRRLLESIIEGAAGLSLVAVAATAHQARAVIAPKAPDVLLLDLHLPDGHGFDVGMHLRGVLPGLRVVVLSEHVRPQVLDMLPPAEAPMWSYVLKANLQSADDLIDVVRAPRARVDESVRRAQGAQDVALAMLNDRQREILRLVAAGYSNAAIAEALVLQPKSVEYHLTHIYATLGLKDDPAINPRVHASRRFTEHEA